MASERVIGVLGVESGLGVTVRVGVGVTLGLLAVVEGALSSSAGAGPAWLQDAAASDADIRAATRKDREPGIQKWYTISVSNQGEGEYVRSTESTAFAPEADRVAAVLRDQIIDGVRAPGTRLVERDLAAELAVSRIPVRDALRTLVAEGLVTPRPRTWAVVRTFTAADIDELIEVRSALETLAFRRAAERGSAEQLAELAGHLATEQRAVHEGDGPGARRAAADFHEAVIVMAANRLLSELFASTGSRIRWLLGQHSAPGTMAAEHDDLYRALLERDGERASALAHAHLLTSRRAALAHQARHPAPAAE